MTPLLAPKLRVDSERSFERLYRRHVRDVYGYALGMLGNEADAEDVTQTTFLNAYRALARGERVENGRAWLLAIAQNVCRQRFRTASRRPQEVELDPELAEAFVEEGGPGVDDIRAALLHLAFNQRAVLVLREIEGRSYQEIAELMGLSVSAVETLLFRARRALREQLDASERPLGCEDAEVFISRQLDGRLARHERGQLRAHLRACPGCATYARSQRAQRKALRGMGGITLPAGLAGALGWSLGGSAAAKAAALVASVAVIGTGVAVGTGTVPAPWSGPEERSVEVVAATPAAPPAVLATAAAAESEEPASPAAGPPEHASGPPSTLPAGAGDREPKAKKDRAESRAGSGRPEALGTPPGQAKPKPDGGAAHAAAASANAADPVKPEQAQAAAKAATSAGEPAGAAKGTRKETAPAAAKKRSPSPLLGPADPRAEGKVKDLCRSRSDPRQQGPAGACRPRPLPEPVPPPLSGPP